MISDDFYVIFRVVKHSKKILADNQLFTGLRDGSPGLSLGTPIRPTERFRNRVFIKALYAGGWAVLRPTCVSEFDTNYRFRLIHRGSAMTQRCLYLLGKMLQKGAEIWSPQKCLYQQVSRRNYRRVLRKIIKIPILKSANS